MDGYIYRKGHNTKIVIKYEYHITEAKQYITIGKIERCIKCANPKQH